MTAPRGLLGDTFGWLGDKAHYRGSNGVVHLTVLHLEVTALAMLLAVAVALPLGLLAGHLRRGGVPLTVLANLSRAVPTLGLLIVFASLGALGVRLLSAVLALAVFAVPPMLSNTYAGMVSVDGEVLQAARGMGLSERQVLTRVELPLALPLLAAGVRTAVVQTFATATLAAYVGRPTLGTLIQLGQADQTPEEVLGAALLVGLLAVALDLLLGRVQALLTPGPRRGRRVLPGPALPEALAR